MTALHKPQLVKIHIVLPFLLYDARHHFVSRAQIWGVTRHFKLMNGDDAQYWVYEKKTGKCFNTTILKKYSVMKYMSWGSGGPPPEIFEHLILNFLHSGKIFLIK